MVTILLTVEDVVENIGGTGGETERQESGQGKEYGFKIQKTSGKDERGQYETVLDPLVGSEEAEV
jgi:hypothetical protein